MNSEDCQAESLNRMSPQTPLLHSQVLASNASYQTDIPIGVSHEVPLETSSESRIISGVEAQKLPVPQFESDKTALTLNNLLKERIVVKVDQLSADIPKRSRRIVVLYSDTFCPILRYHTELLSEVIRVLPTLLQPESVHPDKCDLTTVEPSEEEPPECHVVATVLSFKSDLHVELVLPEPFQMDLFDRQNYAKIQINDSPLASQKSLVLDDTWARIQPKSYDESSSSDGCDAMDEVSQALKDECDRLGSILEDINRNSAGELAPLELVCILEQSEVRNYNLPKGIECKVAFVISKDREERPRSVALKTSAHWLDRLFLKFGYSQEWTNEHMIPLYITLPSAKVPTLEAQRPSASFTGVPIHLSAERPLEAQTRIRVKEGRGEEVLESSVLNEIERTKVFEMRAIRRPDFLHLMGSKVMHSDMRIGGGLFNGWTNDTKNNDNSSCRGIDSDNPFL